MTRAIAFLGVDSGGTRTDGRLGVVGPSGALHNYTYASNASLSGAIELKAIPDVLARVLSNLPARLQRLKTELSLTDIAIHIWIGAAGFTPWTRSEFESAVMGIPEKLDLHVAAIGVANDAVSLLLGSGAQGVIIAGTGSSVLVRSSDGPIKQSGGHEWVACDNGSGFWIGLCGIRAAFRDFEDCNGDSMLLPRLREAYGISEDDDTDLIATIRRMAIANRVMKKNIAHFARFVCEAAERGDETAQDLVKSAAEDLADLTAQAIRRSIKFDRHTGLLKFALCGSLLGNRSYRSSFEGQIKTRLGSELYERIEWLPQLTGTNACFTLAEHLAKPNDPIDALPDDQFQPVICRWPAR